MPRGVYPRACGGTRARCRITVLVMGLSPRVRGNRVQLTWQIGQRLSIPARAGEPNVCRIINSRSRDAGEPPTSQVRCEVYPRACGGTSS